ncbi:MAG: hypothetical protein ACRDWN_07065 [Acidimicrobiales bacterium]
MAVIGLVKSRDGLQARMRHAGLTGVPPLAQAPAMVASYLGAERKLSRIAADAEGVRRVVAAVVPNAAPVLDLSTCLPAGSRRRRTTPQGRHHPRGTCSSTAAGSTATDAVHRASTLPKRQ